MIGGTDWKGGEERSVWIFIIIIIIIFEKQKANDFALEAFGERSTLWRNVIFFLS